MTKQEFARWYLSFYGDRVTDNDCDICKFNCKDNALFACEHPCLNYQVYQRLRLIENMVFGKGGLYENTDS
jgi:hypothetical protein